jgi:hypothetical protein
MFLSQALNFAMATNIQHEWTCKFGKLTIQLSKFGKYSTWISIPFNSHFELKI